MTNIIASIRGEFMRYKSLAEGAIRQVGDHELSQAGAADNSIAVICWHVSGNLRSRFTDFLTSDGEKPWRKRDEEFEPRAVARTELLEKWEQGWAVLFGALDGLREDQLGQTVTIRGQSVLVHEALHRALAHLAYHVGQIVYIAKSLRGAGWDSLSIPPGGSDRFNASPPPERFPPR
jgi:hypothetical protein